ncbi:MAG TPA: VanZ family protein [bacterium]|nr:VanZ family protein [bacterium]
MQNLIARMARRVRGREWLPAALWAAAILIVSSIPDPDFGAGLFPGCDKVAHFIEYSILGGLIGLWALGLSRAKQRAPRGGWLLAAAILFGGLDELHQRFIPGRSMEFWDFMADATGSVTGFLVWSRWLLRRALP